MVRMHAFCGVVVAVLSASPSSAWQIHNNGWPHTKVTSRSSSTEFRLSMTAVPRKMKPFSSKTNTEYILDDGEGHINADLASSLWNWDFQARENAKLPKLSLSTRQGLRLVNEVVAEIADSPRGQKILRQGTDDAMRTDLVQEGIVALMDALNEYRQSSAAATIDDNDDHSGVDPNKRFEAYARPYLENRLWATLDRTERPVQLPEMESTLWRHIQLVRPQMQEEMGGRAPTNQELAARLELPTETLELLMAARRESLSVESTVEIMTPASVEDTSPHFTDQDQWDTQEGHLLDTGDGIPKNEVLVEEYQDEMYQYEGEDLMWIHQTQVAAPLRELIPDMGPSPDDLALSDMIRHDVGEFLTRTLTKEEVLVVRMAFGLDGGKQVVWEEIALSLDVNVKDAAELMTASQVKKLLKGALEKLREAYQKTYMEEDLFGEEDSV